MARSNRIRWEEQLETGEPEPKETENATESRIVAGSLWMLGLTLLFFFLPVVNGMAAGIVGGHKIGNTKTAVTVSLFLALLVGFLLWALLSLMPLPFAAGEMNEISLALLVALSDVALVIGAAIGGTIAQNRIDRLNRA